MQAISLRSRVIQMTIAMVTLLMAGNASATVSYFEQTGYEEEMNRCIDVIRPTLQSPEVGKVIYEVQDIDLRGPWYRFTINISMEDQEGSALLKEYQVSCKANRWIEVTRLEIRSNSLPLPDQLELLANQ